MSKNRLISLNKAFAERGTSCAEMTLLMALIAIVAVSSTTLLGKKSSNSLVIAGAAIGGTEVKSYQLYATGGQENK